MPTTHIWKFRCGHQATHIKQQVSKAVTLSGIPSINGSDVLIESPDPCPECQGDKRKAQDHKKDKAREECQEAISAHKAHSRFLGSQVTNTKNNPELKRVFEKMLNESKVFWGKKVQELATSYEDLEGPQEAHNVTFEKSLEDVQEMIDLMATVAANTHTNRDTRAAIMRRLREWTALQIEHKELKNVYEEKTKQGFEDVASKLEAIRRKASALIKDE